MEDSFLHYEIIEKLGEGGMGIVYLARDTRLDRRVALKFLPAHIAEDSSERERFRQEARSAAGLNHPNIAQVYAIEESGDRMCIVMEYVEGEQLRRAIEENNLTTDDKIEVARQIALGMRAAHQEGIIHRDIKSGNIMIDEDRKVKIMDFGLARIRGTPHITKKGATVGTTAYMAPEQLAGEEADEQSDLWSFGVVLYELFSGRMPFEGIYEQAVIYSITNEEPEPVSNVNTDIPRTVEQVINRCLEKNAGDRYPSAEALLADLRGEDSGPVASPVNSWVARLGKSPLSTALFFGLPAAVILILLLVAWPFSTSQMEGSSADRQIIAVLPVENINDNPALQPLCEGLPETFTARLSKLGDIRDSYWVAPASEMRRQEVKSASQAQAQFGADLVVMSSIHTVADSTKFSINLVDANNMRQLGSEQVVVASENLVGLEQQGIRAMLNMMRMEINPNIAQLSDEADTADSQVYEYLRGTLSKADGEFEQAIIHFRNALEIDPGYGPAYRGLAEVYERQGEWERAVETYKKAISGNPDSWEGYRDLGKYYADRGRYELAIDQFQKVVELIPDNSMAYSNLGAAYHYNGQVQSAEEMYEKALELDNNAIAASNLGVIYYSKRQFEEAAAMFEMAVKAYPDRYDVWGNLAAAYEFSGRPEDARENYRTAIDKALEQLEADSANVDLLGNLGAYYSDLGDTANAIRYIKRATELEPSLDRVRQRAVAIYEELGMRREALRWIDSSMTTWVESQPDFQDLVGDPRYRDLKEQWSVD